MMQILEGTTTAADADAACVLPRSDRESVQAGCSLGLHLRQCQAMGCTQFQFLEATVSTTARFPGSPRDT
jgi:hypothetical protein